MTISKYFGKSRASWGDKMIKILWHVWKHGHSVRVNRNISVPLRDTWSKGWYYECECGKSYAR